MKKIFQVCAAALTAAALSVSCTENPLEEEKVSAKIQEVTGIEAVYALDKNEVLEITPEIKFTAGEVGELTYQWILGETTIGEEAALRYTCAEDGEFEAAFKVSIDGQEPFVKSFKVIVAPQIAMVKEVKGIEASYEIKQDSPLSITPEISFTEGEVGTLVYEWKLGNELIGAEANLEYTCTEVGEFAASFSVKAGENEAVVKEFQVKVLSKYATISEITGVEQNYEVAMGEKLAIAPEVKFTEGEVAALTYEWKIGDEIIGTDPTLEYTCGKAGEFDGTFKVTHREDQPVIANFKVNVTVPESYDNRGILLLTDDENGSMLTYKRLDVMDAPAYKDVFKKNNSDKVLGKNALDIAWFGAYLTDYKTQLDRSTDLDILISSDQPNKVYTLDPVTLKVKDDIPSPIPAQKIFIPNCFQQEPFSDHRAYFIGNKVEKVLTTSNLVWNTDLASQYELSNYATSMMASEGDYLRIYHDSKWNTFVYMSLFMNGDVTGDNRMDAPIFMQAAMGTFDTEMQNVYLPGKLVAVTNKEGVTKAFIITPPDIMTYEEVIESSVETTGKILPESAIAVHPTLPVLYYSNGNKVCSVNIETGAFTDLFTIEGNFNIRKIAMNIYDPETLFIAAENQDETSSMKASLFVYSIKNGASEKLYEEHQVGGTVHQLIYKGDATENLDAPAA